MAQTPPSAGRPGRQLIVLSLVSLFLFAMMFFSGTGGMGWLERMEPRLGIDLVGGTRVTLQAVTVDGQTPSEDALERAREIIQSRVNALGVEEAEVVVEGEDRIVVSVAGQPENALRSVGEPAELRFRKVIDRTEGFDLSDLGIEPEDPAATPTPGATPSPGATPTPEATPDPAATPSPEPGGEGGQASPSATPDPSPSASPGPTPAPTDEEDEADPTEIASLEERQAAVEEKISFEAMQVALALVGPAAEELGEEQTALLEEFRELTGPEVAVLPAKLQFAIPTITCRQLNARPPGSILDPDQVVVSCDNLDPVEDGVAPSKYLLDVAKVVGTDVTDASAQLPPGTSFWNVSISFTGDGQTKWTDLTREATQNDSASPFNPELLAANVVLAPEEDGWRFDTGEQALTENNRYLAEPTADGQPPWVQCAPGAVGDVGNCLVATVLDNSAVSVPQIQQVIPGDAQVSGNFRSAEAQLLASQLRFGALPLTFVPQEEQTITATLGVEYLKAGLLAAAIGVALVLLYVFFYYRLLGTVILGSLITSSALTYAALVVLGRGIGYTLTLAGIAGFIVAVGIAADSFVIYFERLKDEIREGRTPRSAVPRAWVRARRTIITANTVTLGAALVLYLLAAGQVRGFAFALGLATVLDLLIVFTFRHPIMTLLARTRAFLSPRVSGLGRALELDRAAGRRLTVSPTGTGGPRSAGAAASAGGGQ